MTKYNSACSTCRRLKRVCDTCFIPTWKKTRHYRNWLMHTRVTAHYFDDHFSQTDINKARAEADRMYNHFHQAFKNTPPVPLEKKSNATRNNDNGRKQPS